MFKKVEYVGFENEPDLKAKAERATEMLGGVMRSWRDDVWVSWKPSPFGSGALELALSLTLSNASGTATGRVREWTFESGEEGELRSDLRSVWLKLLSLLGGQQVVRLEEILREPVEA